MSDKEEQSRHLTESFATLTEDQVRSFGESEFKICLDQVVMVYEVCEAEVKARTTGGRAVPTSDVLRDRMADQVQAMSEPDLGRFVQSIVLLLETCDKESKRRRAGGKPIVTPSIGRA